MPRTSFGRHVAPQLAQTLHSWRLHYWHTMALTGMSEEIGATLHDWVNNYGGLYRSAHCAVFDKIDQYLVWRVIRKYKV